MTSRGRGKLVPKRGRAKGWSGAAPLQNRYEIIANDQGNRITPSHVSATAEGERLIGDVAKIQLTTNPLNNVIDAKGLIGRDWDATNVVSHVKLLLEKVTEKDSNDFPYEAIVQAGSYICMNFEKGCTQKLTYHEFESHFKGTCPFGNRNICFVSGCYFATRGNDLIEHYKEYHGVQTLEKSKDVKLSLLYNRPEKELIFCAKGFQWISTSFKCHDKHVFLAARKEDGTLSLWLMSDDNMKDVENYTAKIKMGQQEFPLDIFQYPEDPRDGIKRAAIMTVDEVKQNLYKRAESPGSLYMVFTIDIEVKVVKHNIAHIQGDVVNPTVRMFVPQQIFAKILSHMKEIAEIYSTKGIMVPAYFNCGHRQAAMDTSTIAGLTVMRIIKKPTAGGILYGMERCRGEKNVLVFDCSGGTVHVSLLTVDAAIHPAGKNLEQNVMDYVMRLYRKKDKDVRKDNRASQQFRREVEKTKRTLSSAHHIRIEIQSVAYAPPAQASVLSGEQDTGDLIFLDVNPLTSGIENAGGVMTKLIPSNIASSPKQSDHNGMMSWYNDKLTQNSRSELEEYACSLKKKIGGKLGAKLIDDDKTKIQEAVEASLDWIQLNPEAKCSGYQKQKKELEDIAQPMIVAAAGGAASMGDSHGKMVEHPFIVDANNPLPRRFWQDPVANRNYQSIAWVSNRKYGKALDRNFFTGIAVTIEEADEMMGEGGIFLTIKKEIHLRAKKNGRKLVVHMGTTSAEDFPGYRYMWFKGHGRDIYDFLKKLRVALDSFIAVTPAPPFPPRRPAHRNFMILRYHVLLDTPMVAQNPMFCVRCYKDGHSDVNKDICLQLTLNLH